MTYFEFYEIPEGFTVDADLVKKKFYEFSRKYHPDFFANESEEKQAEVLEKSTLNTNAYDTFKDEKALMLYVLTINGKLKEGSENTLPQAFLMEMMDVNEQLMELEMEQDQKALDSIVANIEAFENKLKAEVNASLVVLEGKEEAEKNTILEKVKDFYLKDKYLLRIKERLNTFAHRSE